MSAIALSASSWRQAFVLAAVLVVALASGASAKSWMGIQVGAVPADLAQAYRLPPGVGVYVLDVEPESPAATAGMEPGDIVVEIDGQIQLGPDHLRHIVGQRAASQTLWVGLYRGGEAMSGPVTLATAPKGPTKQAAGLASSGSAEPWT